jgi:glutamyl-tRNA synthetase
VTERLRFSPAPTGRLHLGGARTALFNDLVARGRSGTLILRFEDTDVERSDAAMEPGLIEDLAWLGISWDEGPDVGGPCAPYRQSQRSAIYADALQTLQAAGAVYRCFCSDRALAAARDEDVAEGRAPRYHGTCRSIDREVAATRAESGEAFCWRFSVGGGQTLTVEDEVHGRVDFRTAEIGDFVVARSDGSALYDLACAVDDAAMGVTLVIRGDDHLSNTPRQVLLLRALGAEVPRYAHVPLVMGADGRPLSKSRGAQSISSLRDAGFLAEAVVNHLALLGWSDPAGREVLTHAQIAEAFDLSRVSGSSPAHDETRLRWLNRRHMSALPPEERAALVARFVPTMPGLDRSAAALAIAADLEVAGDARTLLAGVAEPQPADTEAAEALATATARPALQAAAAALSASPDPEAVRGAFRDAGLPAREAMPAVRAALTGRAHGLPVATIIALLGVEESLSRIALALA